MIDSLDSPIRFVIALALGFLVGLERESTELERKQQRMYAGVRTYTILSLYGFGCAWLFRENITLALPIGLLSVVALLVVAYIDKVKHDRVGWTSESSALLVFITGALALLTDYWVPLALGLINAFLLSEKSDLGKFVERLDKTEFLAVLKFLVITLIVFPILPNRDYTQFHLNPAHIWELVILVSSIGFVGYFLSKRFGGQAGLWVSGVLGGIVSSTATSVSVGRIAQRNPGQSENALQASILASSVMYLRILVLILLINTPIGLMITWKMVALAVLGVIFAVTIQKQPEVVPPPLEIDPPAEEKKSAKALTSPPAGEKKSAKARTKTAAEEEKPNKVQIDSSPPPNPPEIMTQNPFELRPAFLFVLVYVVVTVLTELVFVYLGSGGLLGFSAIVGLTDIVPYVLSLVRRAEISNTLIVSALIIAMASNTLVKGAYFSILAKNARKEAWLRYAAWALLHLPLLLIP